MKEIFFTQHSWQGIPFAELGVPLDPGRPAGPKFYDSFYEELERRYPHFENLSESWRTAMARTSACLAAQLRPDMKVLSFGAGIGAVEKFLVEDHGFSAFAMWDFSARAVHYSPHLAEHFLPGDRWPLLDPETRFDAIYGVQVLYALDRNEAIATLSQLTSLLTLGGRIILVDTSIDPIQNNEGSPDATAQGRRAPSFVKRGARRLRSVRNRLQTSSRSPSVQGWGWRRDNQCVQEICRRAGLVDVTSFPCGGESVTVGHVA